MNAVDTSSPMHRKSASLSFKSYTLLGVMQADLDGYLKSRQPADFFSSLLPRICKDGLNEIDAPRVSSLVLYVRIQAIVQLRNSQIPHTLAHTPEM